MSDDPRDGIQMLEPRLDWRWWTPRAVHRRWIGEYVHPWANMRLYYVLGVPLMLGWMAVTVYQLSWLSVPVIVLQVLMLVLMRLSYLLYRVAEDEPGSWAYYNKHGYWRPAAPDPTSEPEPEPPPHVRRASRIRQLVETTGDPYASDQEQESGTP